jgi:hypothetical protein
VEALVGSYCVDVDRKSASSEGKSSRFELKSSLLQTFSHLLSTFSELQIDFFRQQSFLPIALLPSTLFSVVQCFVCQDFSLEAYL